MKKCTNCKEEKPIEEYHWLVKGERRHAQCKVCRNKKRREAIKVISKEEQKRPYIRKDSRELLNERNRENRKKRENNTEEAMLFNPVVMRKWV